MKQMTEAVNDARCSTLDSHRPHAVERQQSLGKLTARQRLDLLFDPHSFMELGQLAHAINIAEKQTPADGVITGIGKIDGRPAAVVNYDFTVLGGSQGEVNHAKTDHLHKIAVEQGLPVVYLLDGGGARAQDIDTQKYYYPEMWADQVRLSGYVPMAAAVLGPCYAGHANLAGLSDFVVMNSQTGSMGIAGTHLVRGALGIDITPLELGGAQIHAQISGAADMTGQNDADCIEQIKRFLSFFPTRAGVAPPVADCTDPVDRREESLLDMVPVNHRRGYDMYRVIRAVVDHGNIFDVKGQWAPNIITCLARLNGRSVGIVANQAGVMAGVIDSPAAEKMSHFVEMCDAFDVPIVLFADVPGFMAGPDHEKSGLVRRSMKTLYALGNCTVPVISLVIRKSFGMGGYVMGSRGFRPNLLLGWPTAEMGGMGLDGAVEIMHRREIAASDDPARLRTELVQALGEKMKAMAAARAYGFDDVIDPRDTRPVLIRALAYLKRKDPHLPPKKHGIAPF